MTVFAIDPGTHESAIVVIVPDGGITLSEIWPNDRVLAYLWRQPPAIGQLVIEQIRGYGRVVGNDVIDTAVWIGRFMEAWDGQVELIARKTVVTELCGDARGNDAAVRAALIDRWGGPAAVQRATKPRRANGNQGRAAGPLAGIRADCWQALGVAMAWRDMARRAQVAATKGGQRETVRCGESAGDSDRVEWRDGARSTARRDQGG